jgi:hypothetical protein
VAAFWASVAGVADLATMCDMKRDLRSRLLDIADDVNTSVVCREGLYGNIFEEAAYAIEELQRAVASEELAGVWDDWVRFRDAATPVSQADALLTFANAFFHYATAVLGFERTMSSSDEVDAGDMPAPD